ATRWSDVPCSTPIELQTLTLVRRLPPAHRCVASRHFCVAATYGANRSTDATIAVRCDSWGVVGRLRRRRHTRCGRRAMSSLIRDVAQYERWLSAQCKVVKSGLALKHERMRKSAFHFLRATYFRWARTIDTVCPGFASAPRVLCVGDTHVENFG